MKRVVVFQGLGVAVPNEPLPPGVWQRGQPSPAFQDAVWFRTQNIDDVSVFPQTNPTPAANCRICPPGDTSPDCCVSSYPMRQYRNFGREAYDSAVLPWNQQSLVMRAPPTTGEVVANAMDASLRQSQLEMAAPSNDLPPDPELQLRGFLGNGGQGQTHLLGLGNGQGQQHLLGYANRYSPFGCTSCGDRLSGTFTNDDGTFTTAGKVAGVVGFAALGYVAYRVLRKKKR